MPAFLTSALGRHSIGAECSSFIQAVMLRRDLTSATLWSGTAKIPLFLRFQNPLQEQSRARVISLNGVSECPSGSETGDKKPSQMEQLSPNLRILKSPFGGSSSPVIRYFLFRRTSHCQPEHGAVSPEIGSVWPVRGEFIKSRGYRSLVQASTVPPPAVRTETSW